MGNYPDLFEGVTHIYDINGDAIDVWSGLTSTVTGADLTTDSRGVPNNAYDFVSGNSDKIALGDVAETKTVVLRVNLDSTTENIFEGSANDKELYASGGTLTYPDRDNVYVDGVDTDTITTGRHTIVLTSTTDVDCTAFQLGIINATYGNFVIEWMATFDLDKSSYALAFHNLLTQQYIYPFDKTLPVWWKENCKLLLNGDYSGTTVYDQSGEGNNGTAGNMTYGRIGRHKTMECNGSNGYISTYNPMAALGNNPTFSISTWWKFKTGNTIFLRYFGNYNTTTEFFDFISNGTDVPSISTRDSTNSLINQDITYTFTNGNWYYITITRTSGSIKIYVNGGLTDTVTDNRTGHFNSGGVYNLGRVASGTNYGITEFSQFKIYENIALSLTQVQELYYRTFIPNV